jgi:hypothetical protein
MRRFAFLLTSALFLACGSMESGACVVDSTSCFDEASSSDCRAREGDIMYWSGDTCADRGFLQTCPGKQGRYKSCV